MNLSILSTGLVVTTLTILPHATTHAASDTLACTLTENTCDQILSAQEDQFLVLMNQELAGARICLAAGRYKGLYVYNVQGSAEEPVTITNCGGKVILDGKSETGSGAGIMNSRYIRLTGSGVDNIEYGIRIIDSGAHGVNADLGTRDFEVDRVEVSGGYSGISVRTYPQCDGSFTRENWSLENVKVNNNYVHDVSGEGLYIGTSHYHMSPTPICPDSNYLEAASKNITVHNNKIEDVGRDGIQIGGGIEGVNVFNNTIERYALSGDYGHIGGIQINPGTVGSFHSNWIEALSGDTKANAIQYAGGDASDVNIYNNIIIGAETAFLSLGRMSNPNHEVSVINNTIVNSSKLFYLFCPESTIENFTFKNNIFAGYQTIGDNYWADYQKIVGNDKLENCWVNGQIPFPTNDETDYHFSANLFFADANSAQFMHLDDNDFRLSDDSPAINAGEDYSWLIEYDYVGEPRNSASIDMGAYAYQAEAISLTYKVNFEGEDSDDGWNALPLTFYDTSVVSIWDETGTSNIGVAITSHFCGGKSAWGYLVTPENPIVMPNEVLNSFWYTCSDQVGEITLSGLAPNTQYTLSLIGSRLASDTRVTRYSVNQHQQDIVVSNNNDTVAVFEDMSSHDGVIKITVENQDNDSGNAYGYINGLVIHSTVE